MGRISSPGRVKNFLFSTSSRPALVPTHPPIQRVRGAISRKVKLVRREADHSPATSAEVTNYGAIPSYPIRLLGVVLN
jgi:hypothetical protein